MKEIKPLFMEVRKFLVRGFSAIYTSIRHILLGPPEDLSKYIGEKTFVSTAMPQKGKPRSESK